MPVRLAGKTISLNTLENDIIRKNYKDPRVCDTAGHILVTRWPDRYAFDLSEPVADKDRKIASMLDAT